MQWGIRHILACTLVVATGVAILTGHEHEVAISTLGLFIGYSAYIVWRPMARRGEQYVNLGIIAIVALLLAGLAWL